MCELIRDRVVTIAMNRRQTIQLVIVVPGQVDHMTGNLIIQGYFMLLLVDIAIIVRHRIAVAHAPALGAVVVDNLAPYRAVGWCS